MLIIGEKINALNPLVCKSLLSENLSFVVSLALWQAEAGADALDVNIGPDISKGRERMQAVVTAVQSCVDLPVCLNGTPEMIEAGLRAHRGRAIINGVTGNRERRMELLRLAKEYRADIIGMAIPGKGYADSADAKCSIATQIIEEAGSFGINPENIFLDPVMTAFSIRSDALTETVMTLRMFKELFSGIRTITGLNSISQGCRKENRSVINSTALGVLAGAGLDAAILNPMDRLVMDTAKTAGLLCEEQIYCDAYLCA